MRTTVPSPRMACAASLDPLDMISAGSALMYQLLLRLSTRLSHERPNVSFSACANDDDEMLFPDGLRLNAAQGRLARSRRSERR